MHKNKKQNQINSNTKMIKKYPFIKKDIKKL